VEQVAKLLNGIETDKSVVHFRSGDVVRANFGEGKLYDVAEGVQFAEVAYQAQIASHIVFRNKPQHTSPWLSFVQPGLAGINAPGNLFRLSDLGGAAL
jgi:hypothetical protein